MAVQVKMPQLSDTMNAGKILRWRKNPGDSVSRGEALAEVETEKANLEIESFHQGVLLQILVPAGNSAKVGEFIAIIGEAGENVTAGSTETVSAPRSAAVPTETSAVHTPVTQTPQLRSFATQQTSAHSSSGRIKASPLAKKIAGQRNIDLSSVRGSGPEGRIVRKDLDSLAAAGNVALHVAPSYQQSQVQTLPPQAAQSGSGSSTPFTKMRETIARRMQESVREAPHFYSTISINMREALKLRAALKEREEFAGLNINHFIIKAAALALSREPRVNAAVRDGQVYQPAQINIGIITALEDGLLIPVIKSADTLSLGDVAFEARAAVDRARAGRPNSQDLSGGTFSISNMGMFDVENFTAIINPGQGAVLAVSAIKEVPVVEHGHVVPGQQMKVTLSVDHRIIDGVMAVTFLKHFKEALEVPALLLL